MEQKKDLQGADRFGKHFYCVVSDGQKTYVAADKAVITDSGNLILLNEKTGTINMAVPAGKWDAVFAASKTNGNPVAVSHWEGVDRA